MSMRGACLAVLHIRQQGYRAPGRRRPASICPRCCLRFPVQPWPARSSACLGGSPWIRRGRPAGCRPRHPNAVTVRHHHGMDDPLHVAGSGLLSGQYEGLRTGSRGCPVQQAVVPAAASSIMQAYGVYPSCDGGLPPRARHVWRSAWWCEEGVLRKPSRRMVRWPASSVRGTHRAPMLKLLCMGLSPA